MGGSGATRASAVRDGAVICQPRLEPEATLGLSHLPFEAMIPAARLSADINDFPLVAVSCGKALPHAFSARRFRAAVVAATLISCA